MVYTLEDIQDTKGMAYTLEMSISLSMCFKSVQLRSCFNSPRMLQLVWLCHFHPDRFHHWQNKCTGGFRKIAKRDVKTPNHHHHHFLQLVSTETILSPILKLNVLFPLMEYGVSVLSKLTSLIPLKDLVKKFHQEIRFHMLDMTF